MVININAYIGTMTFINKALNIPEIKSSNTQPFIS